MLGPLVVEPSLEDPGAADPPPSTRHRQAVMHFVWDHVWPRQHCTALCPPPCPTRWRPPVWHPPGRSLSPCHHLAWTHTHSAGTPCPMGRRDCDIQQHLLAIPPSFCPQLFWTCITSSCLLGRACSTSLCPGCSWGREGGRTAAWHSRPLPGGRGDAAGCCWDLQR